MKPSLTVLIRRTSARALATALNFVRERTPESCTRLCALLCCVTGCVSGLYTLAFASAHAEHAPTVAALTGNTTALIAAGCVALLTRTRAPEPSPETSP
jgi:hypothetical protein